MTIIVMMNRIQVDSIEIVTYNSNAASAYQVSECTTQYSMNTGEYTSVWVLNSHRIPEVNMVLSTDNISQIPPWIYITFLAKLPMSSLMIPR